MCFIDYKKAFDKLTVSHNQLWISMIDMVY